MTRFRRQPAIRMFAREYFESDLIEQGSGEYDPTFVITKLGAKVNRMMVAGLLERIERRDGDNGANYRGAIRDPTGLHMFNVGSFQPEIHAAVEELVAQFDQNAEPIMMLAIGKASPYQTDDGGVFTGMRLEEFTTINGEGYANWLVETADATLRRIDFFQKARDMEPSLDVFKTIGIPEDLISGLISARGHYATVDADVYMVGVLRALDSAEGNITMLTTENEGADGESSDGGDTSNEQIKEWISEYLQAQDPGDGVPYDSVMQDLAMKGVSRSIGEATVDLLMEDGLVFEYKFGYLGHIGSN
ncbi:MAG: hypothetical protein HOE69_01530 [Euryarchaeota archaeon]|nr:hypothetical protein [Euryarchaeota archaeon]